MKFSDRTINVFALAILGVWTIVCIACVLRNSYTALTVVTPVLVLVAGSVFGVKIQRNGNSK